MGLLSLLRLRLGLTIASSALLLCLSAGLGWMLWQRFPAHKITDQELLREAVAEWKGAGEPGDGPYRQIFEQQASQGYYDDAAATGRLFKHADDVEWSVIELVKVRAENGDLQGAKESIQRLTGSDQQRKGAEAIALIQAQNGDLPGALKTIAPFDTDQVFLAYGRHQIKMEDFEGTLDTAERTKSGYELFYDIGEALGLRGQQSRARKLAAHMKNRKLAALFLECARFTLWPDAGVRTIQPNSCDYSWLNAMQGKFAEADKIILNNKCPSVSFVAARQYPVDPSGAEQLLRANAGKEDLARGLGEIAKLAAAQGNIAEALRFLGDAQSLRGPDQLGSQIREIARAWTIRDGPKAVLLWGRSRPTTEQRTWALIGVAEALGHTRRGR